MLVRHLRPAFAVAFEPKARIAASILFVVIILGAVLSERENLVSYFVQAGPVTLTLNIVMMVLAYGIANMTGLGAAQRTAMTLECGLQNGTLAIFVAATLIGNTAMMVPISVVQPKDFAIGALSQMVLLPVVAFLLVLVWPMEPALAVGVMIIAACPGGVTSNLMTHLARGDTALSVSLTAVISVISVITAAAPMAPDIRCDLGLALKAAGRFEDAIAVQKRVTEMLPNSALATGFPSYCISHPMPPQP